MLTPINILLCVKAHVYVVAQRLRRQTGMQEVVGSNPI